MIKTDVRNIVRTASQQGISSTTIKKSLDLPVVASSIRQVLKNSENLQYSKRKPAPDLEEAHKEERMKFAEEKIFWKSKWDEIIFFDQKKFNSDEPDVSTTGMIYVKI